MSDYTDQSVSDLIVNKLTLAKYTELKNAGLLQADQLYQITDPESAGGNTSWGLISGTLSNQIDLQNALNAKQDKATAINYDNITNCITEIPQDIKLELNNGTLTLKAGSKVYVPNGAGVFDVITITSDLTQSSFSTGVNTEFYLFRYNGYLRYFNKAQISSGSTAPSGNDYLVWYDTTNNIIKTSSDGGSTWNSGVSLPLCKFTATSNTITSIDQVFNGFGYVGNTIYMLPNVKGLLANGFNEDGSLKNYTWTNRSVKLKTFTSSHKDHKYITTNHVASIINTIYDQISSDTQPTVPTTSFWYIPKDNLNARVLSNGTANIPYNETAIGKISIDSTGRVLSLTPKTAFHAVDYNDFSDLKDDVEANTNTLGYKQDIATSVNYDNISNCITEIPQDIKLEISNGSFVLKSGSKLTTGNGTQYITTSDLTISVGSPSGQRMLLITRNTAGELGALVGINGANIFSGTTAPTVTVATAYWYDTTNSVIKRTTDTGSTWDVIPNVDICLPVGLITFTSGTATSIDQVFNGFGYIGSTLFVVPGVKGLSPNGRNADGSLNNIEFYYGTLKTYTVSGTNTYLLRCGINYLNAYINTSYYDEESNYIKYNNQNRNNAICGIFTFVDSKITSLKVKTPFHAVDYNDFKDLSNTVNNLDGIATRNIGEIVESTIPQSDAGLHLLDGSLINGSGVYSDFVNYIANLYNTSPQPDCFMQSTTRILYNYNAYGSITEENGILSNFLANTGYATFAASIPTTSFELVLKVKQTTLTASSSFIEGYASAKGIVLRVTNASTGQINAWIGSGSNFISNVNTGLTLAADTWTLIKVTWDGTNYNFYSSIDGSTWTTGTAQTAKTTAPDLTTVCLGGTGFESYPFNTGSIDLTGCYLKIDNEIVWTGSTTTTYTAEQNWQDTVEKYGSCEKYVYDSTNNTVRIPLRTTEHGDLIDSDSNGTEWYRVYSDGWCEQGGYVPAGATLNTIHLLKDYIDTNYNIYSGTSYTSNTNVYTSVLGLYKNKKSFSLYVNATSYSAYWRTCGYTDVLQYTQQKSIYEYLVISTMTKTNVVVNINNVINDLNDKVDKDSLSPAHVVVETYHLFNSWYRIWSDGWCEQGDSFGNIYTSNTTKTINFLVPFKDTNYNVFAINAMSGNSYMPSIVLNTKSPTDIQLYNTYNGDGNASWIAYGYIK